MTTPDKHADDLHRLISVLGRGQADIFATSGGAVNALALAARHPEQVRALVAHDDGCGPPPCPPLPAGSLLVRRLFRATPRRWPGLSLLGTG